jgi:hypothetical protein
MLINSNIIKIILSAKFFASYCSLGVIIRELFDLDNNIVQKKIYTDLEMKFSILKELNSKMKSNKKEFRPNCDEILNERKKWILSSMDMKKCNFITKRLSIKRKFSVFVH